MRELSETELALKQVCLLHPEYTRCTHLASEGLPELAERFEVPIGTLAPHPLTDELMEEDYFQRGDNVAVFRHIRYLPPVLHRHNFFELIYVRSGSCGNYIDQRELRLERGDLCIVSPKHDHAISAFSDDAEIWNILIRTSTFDNAFFGVISDKDVLSAFFMQSLYGGQGRSFLLFRTGATEDGELARTLETLLRESEARKRYRSRMMDSLLSIVFVLLLRDHEKDVLLPTEEAGGAEDHPLLLLGYIQRNYAHLTLQDLAAHFGYSVRHTSRLLKDSTGQNFGEIVRDLRLRRAAELLANPDMAIPDIIEAAGYTDVSAFYRAFKTYYGMNPATYRKKHST